MTLSSSAFSVGTHAVDEIHDLLRTDGSGVHEGALPDGSPVWIVTGYEAVARLLADPNMSASKSDSTTGFVGQRLPAALDANLLNIDGDQHRRVRRLAASAFEATAHHDQVAREAVGELLAALPERGEIDLMTGLCEQLPLRVMGELLGLPPDKWGEFRAAASPVLQIDRSQGGEAIRGAMATMLGLVAGVIDQKRAAPGDDLVSRWVQARDGEDRLSENELMSLVFVSIVGGFDNVTALTALVLDDVLRNHLDEARRCLDDDAAFGALVRAIMGGVAPVNYALRRFPRTDINVNGVRIPKGHTVMLSLRSANLDPARGTRPELLFGHGRHFCIGANLAEFEVVHATRGVLRKWPHLNLTRDRRGWGLRPSWITYSLAELRATAT